MAVNFPNNPSDQDTFVSSGRTFRFNGTSSVWEVVPGTTGTDISDLTDTTNVIPADVSDLTDTGGLLGSGGTTVYADMAALIAATGMSNGDFALVTANNNIYVYNGSGWYKIATVQNDSPSAITGVDGTYSLAIDGTPTVITAVSTDPEGFPLTWSYSTSGLGSIATVSQTDNVFTITPSTDDANFGTFTLTINATDGVNGAVSANTSISLEFLIANSNYTTLLATAVDTSDNSITDSSTNNYTISVNQSTNVSAGTFSPYRHGGYSMLFVPPSGSNHHYIGLPADASFDFGSGDFTIEGWIYPLSAAGDSGLPRIFMQRKAGSTTGLFEIVLNSDGTIRGGTGNLDSTTDLRNSWNHFAYVKSSNTLKLYINGTEEGSVSDTTTYSPSATPDPVIGAYYNGTVARYNGYLSDFRITKSAVYTSNFTAPTERLTAIANTSLLTFHLPYLADGSTNSHTVTMGGRDHEIHPFAPYDYEEYSADAHGGSVSMPNDNDYLYVPHSSTLKPSGTDPFCVSFWYFPTSSPGTTRQLVGDAKYVSYPTNCPGWDILYDTSGAINARWGYPNYADTVSGITNNIPTLNSWNHIVFCRSGGNLSLFLNGKRCNTFTSNINITASGATNFYVGYAGEATGTAMQSAMGTIADFKYEVGTSQFDATASTITIPTAPQSTTNSVLHIKGSDVSFIDKSQNANIGLIIGTGTSTESPFAGGKSLDLTSTSDDYAYVDGDSIVINANEAYTFEFWMKYVGQSGATGASIFDWGVHSSNGNVALFRQNTGGYKLHITGFSGFSTYSTAYDSLEDGTWKHFALSRTSSGDVKSFIDGSVIESSTGYTLSVADTVKKLRIGGLQNYSGYGIQMYIQDVRITKGLARYTANFTPPTAPLKG